MPASDPEGKPQAIEMVRHLRPDRILDVGPGVGTYRHLLDCTFPDARWTALEIWAPYVEAYGLEELYDEVIVADAQSVSPARVGPIDLAIFGDVIEHMPKPEAICMVNRLPWINALISVPIVPYPQGPYEGNPFEAHLHTWDEGQVIDSFNVVDHWCGSVLGVFLLAR